MMKPLAGRGIVVTRARDQASPFAARLRKLGARVLVCPTIRIGPPKSFKPLDRAIQDLDRYDWLVFTSANGVERFMERAGGRKRGLLPRHMMTCAIGPATAEHMREFGLKVSRVSKEYVAESVLDALGNVRGQRILIPRAAVARDVLPKELKRRGASVDVVEVYRTQPDRSGLAQLKAWLAAGKIDCVTFTSSSTVDHFFQLLGAKLAGSVVRGGRVKAASIGPITTATLLRRRWKPAIAARKPTTPLLAQAIANHYRKGNAS